MRRPVMLALLTLAPAQAQAQVAAFNPAAEYITAGQDEPGYRAWVLAAPGRAEAVAAFNAYLSGAGVQGVVPTWQLLRTATMWKVCGAEPFEVAPSAQWPNMVETLRYVRAHVVPVVGPVEPVSVYRNPVLNVCAKGAPGSAHQLLYAVDLVPLRPTTRPALMRGLCAIHSWQGTGFDVGLGFYKGLRFHVDSKKFRKWGAALGDETTVGCPQVMAEIAAEAAASRAAIAARKQAEPPAKVSTPPADPPADQQVDPLAPGK